MEDDEASSRNSEDSDSAYWSDMSEVSDIAGPNEEEDDDEGASNVDDKDGGGGWDVEESD